VKGRWLWCLVVLAVAPVGCGSSGNCKEACDKLQSCSLNSSGFSCDASCGAPDSSCAQCLNSDSCSDITSGKCASSCPNATFTPK